jgi:hypothetical protein
MPNSYAGQFKDGVYMPLKLDSNHAVWHDQRDVVLDISGSTMLDTRNIKVDLVAGGITAGLYPNLERPHCTLAGVFGGGDAHLCPTTGNLGAICWQGISGSANVKVVVRAGYECQAQPGTPYTSFAKLSPGYDVQAITRYFQISRELKDAYPAEYNDKGKLWDLVKRAAGLLAPGLDMVPYGGLIKDAGILAGRVGDAITARARKGKAASSNAKTVSEAQLERLRKQRS